MWVLLLLLCTATRVTALKCWKPPFQTPCAASDTITGNVASISFENPALDAKANQIVSALKAYNESILWLQTVSTIDYHISLYYFPCVPANYTNAAHTVLQTFQWYSFNVRVSHLCCEIGGYIELCVDAMSQQKLVNLTTAMIRYLNAHGIPVPDLQALQPPHHISLGQVPESFNLTAALSLPSLLALVNRDGTLVVGNGNDDYDVPLVSFYFGTVLYLASDVGGNTVNGLTTTDYAIIGAVAGFVLLSTIALAIYLCVSRTCRCRSCCCCVPN